MPGASPFRAARQQAPELLVGEVAPLSDLEVGEFHVADPHADELLHPAPEMRRHQADLPVEALHQHDPEAETAELGGLAGKRQLPMELP